MPRHPDPAASIVEVQTNAEFDQAAAASHELATLNNEIDRATRQAAALVGYSLPGDSTDPDLIQRDIAINMRRSVEAVLEMGRGLMVLKAACAHGEFRSRLDVLGIDVTVAKKLMASARKFSNGATSHHLLKAAASQSKVFELLVLDDEQIEELELTGQTGELTLDDVATMSVKELRGALRKERQTNEAIRRVSADKDNKINDLSEQLHQHRLTPPDINKEADDLRNLAQLAVGVVEAHLRGPVNQIIMQMAEHAERTGIDHKQYVAGLLAQAEIAFAMLREQHNIEATPSASLIPDWMREGADEQAQREFEAALEGTDWMQDKDGNLVPRANA